jgi:hypothetical protein
MKLIWLTLSVLLLTGCTETPDTNPRKSVPPTVSEQQAEADQRKDRRDLADQVVNGDISFENAGCQYRGGDWDEKKEVCDRYFLTQHDQKVTAQSDLLAAKIQALSALTTDPTTAEKEGTDMATAYLTDHPEDYRGALGAAINSLRTDKLLPPDTPQQTVAITRLTN